MSYAYIDRKKKLPVTTLAARLSVLRMMRTFLSLQSGGRRESEQDEPQEDGGT